VSDGVQRRSPVSGDECRALGDGLGDQKMVERIAVMHRQIDQRLELSGFDVQQRKPLGFECAEHRPEVRRQLPEPDLHSHFPH